MAAAHLDSAARPSDAAASSRSTAAAEFDDLQGILRFGHGRLPDVGYLLLRIREPEAARHWLGSVPLSSAATRTPLPDLMLHVAFTAPGLARIGLAPALLAQFSTEFLEGMQAPHRARRLGDSGSNAPDKWRWGGSPESTPDLLLLVYTLAGGLDACLQNLRNLEFVKAFESLAELRSNNIIDSEPFGFADGISQPSVDWERRQSTDLHRRAGYSNLLAPGELLLGHPNEYGEYTQRPLLAADHDACAALLPDAEDRPGMKDLGRNGSYLVFRQLEQDVQGFWSCLDALSEGDARRREELAEAMVGRRRDGTALVPLTDRPLPGIPEARRSWDNFSFNDDPQGFACPLAAHVRRSNPRTGDLPPGMLSWFDRLRSILGFNAAQRDADIVASTRYHRLLRRGRQYGPALTPEQSLAGLGAGAERGLHFLCLNANLARQFEFVQNAWIANGKFAGLQDEEDPLLGNRQPLPGGSQSQFSRPRREGPCERLSGLPPFVHLRGGAYFFLPGLRALRYLLSCPRAEGG